MHISEWPDYLNMILAVTSRVCAAGSYYACLQFASELFPTEIRGKGSSAFEISGGIGLFIQPQINYLVSKVYYHQNTEIEKYILYPYTVSAVACHDIVVCIFRFAKIAETSTFCSAKQSFYFRPFHF